jgi:antitoxin HigA-1
MLNTAATIEGLNLQGYAYPVDFEQYCKEKTMTSSTALRNPKRCPSHPGAALADILLDIHLPKTEIAEMLGISRQHLHDVLAERKPVSSTVAAHIGKVFGGGATTWILMQANYDAWHAERDIDVRKFKAIKAA